MNPWARERYNLLTHFGPEECQERLQARLISRWDVRACLPIGPQPEGRRVTGSVSAHGFSLTKLIRYPNDLQTVAAGRFVVVPEGTRIEVSLGVGRWTATFSTLWLVAMGILLLMQIITTTACLLGPETCWIISPQWFVISVTMVAIAVGLQWFGRWLARGEARFLREFLREILEATEL